MAVEGAWWSLAWTWSWDGSEEVCQVTPIRWQMDFADQTNDLRCTTSIISSEPHVDPVRIGLFVTSYGGGLVIWVASNDPCLKRVVSQVTVESGKLGGKMASYAQMRTNPAKGIGHHGFCRGQGFAEASGLAVDWFRRHLGL